MSILLGQLSSDELGNRHCIVNPRWVVQLAAFGLIAHDLTYKISPFLVGLFFCINKVEKSLYQSVGGPSVLSKDIVCISSHIP